METQYNLWKLSITHQKKTQYNPSKPIAGPTSIRGNGDEPMKDKNRRKKNGQKKKEKKKEKKKSVDIVIPVRQPSQTNEGALQKDKIHTHTHTHRKKERKREREIKREKERGW